MPHGGPGFFYYRFTYFCPWTDRNGQKGTDNTYHRAFYTPTPKEDHEAQAAWFRDRVVPAIEADVLRNFYYDADRSGLGRTYDRFNHSFVRQLEFRYRPALPLDPSGQPCGRRI